MSPRDVTLRVENLTVSVGRREHAAVRDVSFEVRRGEAVGLVGESGSGKTLTCRAALGILPPGCVTESGRMSVDGVDVSRFGRRDWHALRGRHVGAVFQDPGSYLNPSIPVGRQVAEAIRATTSVPRRAVTARVRELFDLVGLRDPDRVARQLPSELSGGMLQRVMIAIAICADTALLVADEATTALDVTVQAEIIEVIRRLRADRQLSVLFVSHDLAVINELCDRVVVFYAGEVVETGTTDQIMNRPRHPYTRAMMRVASFGDYRRRELEVIPGAPPAPDEERPGCRFADRCGEARPSCLAGPIPLLRAGDSDVRCVRVHEIDRETTPAGHVLGRTA